MITSSIYQLSEAFKLGIIHAELDPDNLTEEQVIAKTVYSVISTGTELAAYSGAPPLRPSKVYPRVMGYCNVAEVIAVGSQVKNCKPGDYILTFQSHRSHFIIHVNEIILTFDLLDFKKEYASLYLFHLGYSSLLAGDLHPGNTVGVVGMGLLGITTAMLGEVAGCDTHCFTSRPESIAKLKALGLQQVHLKKVLEDVAAEKSFISEEGLDVVILTSNTWEDWLFCMKIVRKGGLVIVLGLVGRGLELPDFNPLDSQYFYDKQLTIKSAGYYSDLDVSTQDIRFTLKRNMAYLYELAKKNKIDTKKIISGEIDWTELPDMYDKLHKNKDCGITFLINW